MFKALALPKVATWQRQKLYRCEAGTNTGQYQETRAVLSWPGTKTTPSRSRCL